MRTAMTIGKKLLALALAAAPVLSYAQGGWTLEKCIDHAFENNISVQQIRLKSNAQELRLSTARNSRLPDLSASLGESVYFGRGPGRDGTYEDNTKSSTSFDISTSIPVFAGFRIKHEIASERFSFEASLYDLDKAREDVSLNVTALYLQVLLNKELVSVAEYQVALSAEQLKRSTDLVASGKSAESEIVESRALLAKDEYNLTAARNTLSLSLLDLAQALNLDDVHNFDILTPDLSGLAIDRLSKMEHPDSVLHYAINSRPGVMAEMMRVRAVRSDLSATKAARWPTVGFSAGYSNSYYYTFKDSYINESLREQLKNNGNEFLGLSVRIPIFNRFATRNSIRTADINLRLQELAIAQTQQDLRKEIERSRHNADAAYLQHQSAMRSYEAAGEAMRYEEEKASVGRSTTFDYNDAKTRLSKAEADLSQAKFEYIFRRKILDYYMGTPLDFKKY